MRCFVALDLPTPVRNHLTNVIAPLRSRYDVKWVPADQLHLTLVFAGELPDDAVDDLAHVVAAVTLPPLSLHLQELGHFPPRGVPRVLWAGLGGDAEAVTHLHEELVMRAESLGVEREKRGFTPHVTLGRIRTDFGALAMVDEMRKLGSTLNAKPFAPTGLVLYASELRPGGPLHRVIVERKLPPPLVPPTPETLPETPPSA